MTDLTPIYYAIQQFYAGEIVKTEVLGASISVLVRRGDIVSLETLSIPGSTKEKQ